MNTYSRLNQNQQKSISKVLSDTEGKVVFDKGKPSENTNSNNSVRSIAFCDMNPNLSQLLSATSTSSMTSDTKMSSLFYGNTCIYGGTFNFNNPQSSQKRQSDDSGLQIAKTKYKRILPLSFSDSYSEWTLPFGPTFNDIHFLAAILLNYLFSNYIIHRIWNSFGFINGQIFVCIRLLSQDILPTRLQMKCTQ